MSDYVDHLKSLHTTIVDASSGYDEALMDAEGKGLTPLFREMMALHTAHANAIAGRLQALGEKVDGKGSFLSTIHRTVISIRSLFGGLDETILPGLIDGETRVLGYYDEALEATPAATGDTELLLSQRQTLDRKIQEMKTMKRAAAA